MSSRDDEKYTEMVTIRHLNSGRTTRSTFGREIVFIFGMIVPNSPGMYHRTPRPRRNSYTALSDPPWSYDQRLILRL
jgi:hypothetical protein